MFFQMCRAFESLILISNLEIRRICFNNSKRVGDTLVKLQRATADTLAHRGDEGRGYLR